MNLIGYICAVLMCVVKDVNGLQKSSKYLKGNGNVEQVCAEINCVFTRVGVSSATECAIVCSEENGCDAIFFSAVNGSCSGCSRLTVMTSALVPSTVNVYYQLVNANFSAWHYGTSAYVGRQQNNELHRRKDVSQIYCQLLGAHVVVPDSTGEQDFLAAQLLKTPTGVTVSWIGITDEKNANTFRVEHSGEMVYYTNWADDQPNNYGGNQQCAVLWREWGWKWNDRACSDSYRVVCEHD